MEIIQLDKEILKEFDMLFLTPSEVDKNQKGKIRVWLVRKVINSRCVLTEQRQKIESEWMREVLDLRGEVAEANVKIGNIKQQRDSEWLEALGEMDKSLSQNIIKIMRKKGCHDSIIEAESFIEGKNQLREQILQTMNIERKV